MGDLIHLDPGQALADGLTKLYQPVKTMTVEGYRRLLEGTPRPTFVQIRNYAAQVTKFGSLRLRPLLRPRAMLTIYLNPHPARLWQMGPDFRWHPSAYGGEEIDESRNRHTNAYGHLDWKLEPPGAVRFVPPTLIDRDRRKAALSEEVIRAGQVRLSAVHCQDAFYYLHRIDPRLDQLEDEDARRRFVERVDQVRSRTPHVFAFVDAIKQDDVINEILAPARQQQMDRVVTAIGAACDFAFGTGD